MGNAMSLLLQKSVQHTFKAFIFTYSCTLSVESNLVMLASTTSSKLIEREKYCKRQLPVSKVCLIWVRYFTRCQPTTRKLKPAPPRDRSLSHICTLKDKSRILKLKSAQCLLFSLVSFEGLSLQAFALIRLLTKSDGNTECEKGVWHVLKVSVRNQTCIAAALAAGSPWHLWEVITKDSSHIY